MPTINDIAKICNVSHSTVSYVLSGNGDKRRIAPETQEKIFSAADKLGYTRRRSDGKLPLISIYWPTDAFDMTIVSIIEGVNSALGAQSSMATSSIHSYEHNYLSDHMSELQSPHYDANLIVAGNDADLRLLQDTPPRSPTVLMNRTLEGYSSVSIDHREAGELAAAQAIKNGGDRVALVLNSDNHKGMLLRAQAMIETLEREGISSVGRLYYCGNRIDDGYELARQLVKSGQTHKVFVCAYDMVALGMMNTFSEAGLRVGSEVQVLATSNGNQRLFARSWPPMTVVDLRMKEISDQAMRMAIALASRQTQERQSIIIHPSIVYRQTCPLNTPLE